MYKPSSILRTIRTFVKREGRMTQGQQNALVDLWPQWGIEFDANCPALPSHNFFTQTGRCYLEIGFGNGETLAEMAQLNPDKKFIGIEVHRPGVGSLLQRMQHQQLENIRILNHDAVQIVESNLFPFQFDGIYLLFADPWPKRKHIKRRIVQAEFIQKISGLIKPGGYFYVATDWDDYAIHIKKVMQGQTQFDFESDIISSVETLDSEIIQTEASTSVDALSEVSNIESEQIEPINSSDKNILSMMAVDVITRPNSKYERRGQRLGHKIHDMLYRLKT